jgi:hypothetical protein
MKVLVEKNVTKRFEELETPRIFIGLGERHCSDGDRKNTASASWYLEPKSFIYLWRLSGRLMG